MARSTKLVGRCTVALLLVFMILCDEVSVNEARHLKCKKSKCNGSHSNSHRSTSTSSSGSVITSSSRNKQVEASFKARNHGDQPLMKEGLASEMDETLDDFRPTAPGRSPGAGH